MRPCCCANRLCCDARRRRERASRTRLCPARAAGFWQGLESMQWWHTLRPRIQWDLLASCQRRRSTPPSTPPAARPQHEAVSRFCSAALAAVADSCGTLRTFALLVWAPSSQLFALGIRPGPQHTGARDPLLLVCGSRAASLGPASARKLCLSFLAACVNGRLVLCVPTSWVRGLQGIGGLSPALW